MSAIKSHIPTVVSTSATTAATASEPSRDLFPADLIPMVTGYFSMRDLFVVEGGYNNPRWQWAITQEYGKRCKEGFEPYRRGRLVRDFMLDLFWARIGEIGPVPKAPRFTEVGAAVSTATTSTVDPKNGPRDLRIIPDSIEIPTREWALTEETEEMRQRGEKGQLVQTSPGPQRMLKFSLTPNNIFTLFRDILRVRFVVCERIIDVLKQHGNYLKFDGKQGMDDPTYFSDQWINPFGFNLDFQTQQERAVGSGLKVETLRAGLIFHLARLQLGHSPPTGLWYRIATMIEDSQGLVRPTAFSWVVESSQTSSTAAAGGTGPLFSLYLSGCSFRALIDVGVAVAVYPWTFGTRSHQCVILKENAT